MRERGTCVYVGIDEKPRRGDRERERQQVVVGDYICLFVRRMLSSVVAFLVAAEMRI